MNNLITNELTLGWKNPYDAEVEYLESTGTQWLDTGVTYGSDTGIECDFELTETFQTNSGVFGRTRVSAGYGANLAFIFTGDGGQFRFDRYERSKRRYGDGTMLRRRTINFDPSTKVFSDSVSGVIGNDDSNYTGTFTSYGLTMLVFCRWFARDVQAYEQYPEVVPAKMKLYSFKMYEAGVLSCDLAPVRFTNELGVSEGAMYDRVSGQLLKNRGTGSFIVGLDKNQ